MTICAWVALLALGAAPLANLRTSDAPGLDIRALKRALGALGGASSRTPVTPAPFMAHRAAPSAAFKPRTAMRDVCRPCLEGQRPSPEVIRIASFNIQVFGTDKVANPRVMAVLSRIARQFHVTAVQEFRDETGQAPALFLERINHDARVPYAMVVGPRLGRTDSKEQYAVYYRADVLSFVDSFTVSDRGDRFERPPLVVRFVAGQFDFRLVVAHIKPEDAATELAALARVADALAEGSERDVILLGDFNADCSYFKETDEEHPLRAPRFHWIIGNGVETAVRTGCSYDRIVLTEATAGYELVPNSGRVFRYDREFGISTRLVSAVSDHYPVYAEYRITGPDDDGPRRK